MEDDEMMMMMMMRDLELENADLKRQLAEAQMSDTSMLDFHGELFGVRFTEGCSNGCIELYVEDDDHWRKEITFDRKWLSDLRNVINAAIAAKGEQG